MSNDNDDNDGIAGFFGCLFIIVLFAVALGVAARMFRILAGV